MTKTTAASSNTTKMAQSIPNTAVCIFSLLATEQRIMNKIYNTTATAKPLSMQNQNPLSQLSISISK